MYVFGLMEVFIILIPILLCVAMMTIIERKVLGSLQSRVGPQDVGYYGVLQPFSDFLKLVVKEKITPQHATKSLFFIAPCISLLSSLLGWAVIPFGSGLAIADFALGGLYAMAIASLSIYGIFLAGWAANNKYAFLGSLRATASMISYELIMSSAILIVIIMAGSFNLSVIIETQQSIWYIVPVLPVFLMWFISILAESSRTPFDLNEAESELVAGFFTEHSSIVFVFFFLSEYSSIVLLSGLTCIFWLGGYQSPQVFVNDTCINLQSGILAIKTCMFCFLFVLVSGTLPRVRYDQLMTSMWSGVLPMIIAFMVVIPSVLCAYACFPVS